mmetsp:Transcript_26694/g.42353  ORF Transcript_26694/g.42353 Transcript_26694/m.42353 type:complete len:222 (-) Transcript_26694:15-680(-)
MASLHGSLDVSFYQASSRTYNGFHIAISGGFGICSFGSPSSPRSLSSFAWNSLSSSFTSSLSTPPLGTRAYPSGVGLGGSLLRPWRSRFRSSSSRAVHSIISSSESVLSSSSSSLSFKFLSNSERSSSINGMSAPKILRMLRLVLSFLPETIWTVSFRMDGRLGCSLLNPSMSVRLTSTKAETLSNPCRMALGSVLAWTRSIHVRNTSTLHSLIVLDVFAT